MNNKKRAIALGNFDGIHKGHTAVIDAAVQAAREGDMVPTVLILSPLPSCVIDSREAPALVTEADKDKLFADMGVEVVRIDFLKIKDYAPQEFFVKILAGELNAGMLSCGFNYRFGKGGEGGTGGTSTTDTTGKATNGGNTSFSVGGVDYITAFGGGGAGGSW